MSARGISGPQVAFVWMGCYAFFEGVALPVTAMLQGVDLLPRWYWLAASRLLFAFFAWDCALILLWLYSRWRRIEPVDPVPLRLTEEQFWQSDQTASGLAILLPLHQEARTAAARERLERRIRSLMACSPASAEIHLLFDSPPDQADVESRFFADLQVAGRPAAGAGPCPRLCAMELRDKPRSLRNKPGSLFLWLQEHRRRFEYVLVVDADSSFDPEDEPDGADRDVIRRLLYAMSTGDAPPDLIQTRVRARRPKTILGWLEHEEGAASGFTGRMFALIYGHQAPCFGHNFICRAETLWQHIRTDYLSHDMVESASMAASGLRCYYSNHAVSYEDCEEPLAAWLKRDRRWGRGCAQWVAFLLRKKLPWRPRLYLAIAWLGYASQVANCVAFGWGAVIVSRWGGLYFDSHGHVLWAFALVLLGMYAPRVLGGRPWMSSLLAMFLRGLMGCSLMWWRAWSFLVGPFGDGWIIRDARAGISTTTHVWRAVRCTLPGVAVGCATWLGLAETPLHLGTVLILIGAAAMVCGPVSAAILSVEIPAGVWIHFREKAGSAGKAQTGARESCAARSLASATET